MARASQKRDSQGRDLWDWHQGKALMIPSMIYTNRVLADETKFMPTPLGSLTSHSAPLLVHRLHYAKQMNPVGLPPQAGRSESSRVPPVKYRDETSA
jgi:hypothetical protein